VAEEWESLKTLMEADGAERNMVADDIIGTLGMENKTIKGTIDKRAVQTVVVVVKLLLNGPPKYTN
jgi:enolase